MGFVRKQVDCKNGFLWTRGGGSLWCKVETLSGETVDLNENDLLPLFQEWLEYKLTGKLEDGVLSGLFAWLTKAGGV